MSLFCLLSFFDSVAQNIIQEAYIQQDSIPKSVVSKTTSIVILNGIAEFKKNYPLRGELGTNKAGIITKGYLINPLFIKKDTVYYRFVDFLDSTFANNYNNKVFAMPNDVFESITSQVYSQYKGCIVGAYTVPFRLRNTGGSAFDFESSLSLQTNIVFGFGSKYKKESWLDVSAGIGITSININSKNSKDTTERSASAFTISGGALIKAGKFANIGVFVGWDFLSQKDKASQWIYDGKPWIGLGINISFQEIGSGAASTQTHQ